MLKRSGDESRMGDVSEILMQNPPLGTQLDFDNPLNKGIVMHLAMNEGHGDVVRDLSMNGNHGTLKNMAFPSTAASGWNPGQTGIGLNFDGTDDYVDCGKNGSLQFNVNDFSIGVWLKTYSSATDSAITKRRDTGTLHGFNAESRANGKIRFALSNNGASITRESSAVINDGIWHHAAGVYKRGGNLTVYVDGGGAISSDISSWSGIDISNDVSLKIGGIDLYGNHWDGSIDQVRIHTRAQTAKEVQGYHINPWQVYLDEEDM